MSANESVRRARRRPGESNRLSKSSSPTGNPSDCGDRDFDFLTPVLPKQSPAVLDSINQYLPIVIINGLAAILFMIGYVFFRRRHDQNCDTAALIRPPTRAA